MNVREYANGVSALAAACVCACAVGRRCGGGSGVAKGLLGKSCGRRKHTTNGTYVPDAT